MICPHCGKPFSTQITHEQVKDILSLSRKGFSCREIASLVGVSFASVARILREAKK